MSLYAIGICTIDIPIGISVINIPIGTYIINTISYYIRYKIIPYYNAYNTVLCYLWAYLSFLVLCAHSLQLVVSYKKKMCTYKCFYYSYV